MRRSIVVATSVQHRSESTAGRRLGRFVLLSCLDPDAGRWSAYDVALDRKVVVEPTGNAQAVAKLSHENLAQVYEVVTEDGTDYAVVEHVDGVTVQAWQSEPRDWRQIVDVYRQISRGAHAAHAVSVVHGRLDPNHAIIDSHGRVRVFGFGRTAGGGTPKDDQQRLCEELSAALRGGSADPTKPLRAPAWVRAVVRRGIAPDPAARFDTLDDLATALAADPSRRRRRLVTIAAVGGIAAGTVAWGRLAHANAVAACEHEGAVIAATFDAKAGTAVREGLIAVGYPYAAGVADRVVPRLQDAADQWRDAATTVCLHAEVDRDLDEDTLAKARWCLDDRRDELDALVQSLASAGEAALDGALGRASSLRPASACADPTALSKLPDPPPLQLREGARAVSEEYSRLRQVAEDDGYEEGLPAVEALATRAEAVGWTPLRLSVQALHAHFLTKTGDSDGAKALSRQVYFEAAATGQWDVAAKVAVELVRLLGIRGGRNEEALRWDEHAQVAIAQGELEASRAELQRISQLSRLRRNQDDTTGRVALDERALRLARKLYGRDHPRYGNRLLNLSNAYYARDPGSALASETLHEAIEVWTRTHGPDHPDLAVARGNLGLWAIDDGDLALAQRHLDDALQISERAWGPEHRWTAHALNNVGWIHLLKGEYTEAEAAYRRRLRIEETTHGDGHPNTAFALLRLAIERELAGDLTEAEALATRGRNIWETVLSPEHGGIVHFLGVQARARLAADDLDAAQELAERIIEISDTAMGSENINATFGIAVLGDVAAARGEHDAAIAHHERALKITVAQWGDDHIETAQARVRLGRVLVAAERMDRARQVLGRTMQLYDAWPGTQPEETRGRAAYAEAIAASASAD